MDRGGSGQTDGQGSGETDRETAPASISSPCSTQAPPIFPCSTLSNRHTVQAMGSGNRRLLSSSPSSSSSLKGSISQSPNTSEHSVALPPTAQPDNRAQVCCSTTSRSMISQQAWLAGNGSSSTNQAHVYLHAQMLIFTPASSAGVAQPDLPIFTSASTRSPSAQEQNQAEQTNRPAVQSLPSKTPAHHRMSLCPPKPTQQSDASKEGLYSSVPSHTLMMHKLRCRLSHKMAHRNRLINPKPAEGHSLVHSVSLQAGSLPTSQLFLSSQTPGTPVSSVFEVQSQHCTTTRTLPSASSSSTKQSEVAAQHKAPATSPVATQSPTSHSPAPVVTQPENLVQSLPSALLESPPRQLVGPAQLPAHSPVHKPPSLSPAPSLPASCTGLQSAPCPRTSASSPSQPTSPRPLKPLSPASVQGLTGQMQSSEETPAAKTLVQVPHQDPPPPQRVVKDPQTHLAAPSELPKDLSTVYQMVSLREMDSALRNGEQEKPGNEEMPNLMEPPLENSTQIHPTLLPPAGQEGDCRDTATDLTTGTGQSSTEPKGDAHTENSSVEALHTSSSQASLPPAGGPSGSLPPSASHLGGAAESQLPQAIIKPQVLTHLIEGFVIQEGLKPFPVNRSSLMVEKQAKNPGALHEMSGSEVTSPMMDVEHPWNSTDTDMDDFATDDGMDEVLVDMLHCEFCGKRGYAHTFLRANRFCSTTCVRRFNVSNTRRISALKANRTGRGKDRRRGRSRRPSSSREHFHRQAAQSTSWWPMEAEEEEDPPVPMTTRLRRQAELERERETADSGGSPPTSPSSPVLWTVDQVCAFVYTLPGCQDIAEEFRSQEIDGQALLLLTEDHLMSTMNIRLGPALKICARINSLKEA
ncbi:polyhomeotic-like protein 3 isoform X2 [Anguilla anguilla]|uniref:polyhomeotic-like protein 3 isoform X2 n=1 Tax=Anguilla anguilla TaxID=7936 RepID=UPI0015AF24FA|nr:polyhomeotic-like protein 3 isoform X2 [Anguilla anguilla]